MGDVMKELKMNKCYKRVCHNLDFSPNLIKCEKAQCGF